jgi:DtxR family Mn-dependent transcriptional regulator
MEWEKVHDVAEELEHVSSIELINRLDDFLGNPKIDPHGDPIPDEKGKIAVLKQRALKDLPLKQNAIVSSVSNQTTEMMEMLNHYGIGIGSQIKVLKAFEFDGSLQIKIAKKPECIISGMAAQNIFVYDN